MWNRMLMCVPAMALLAGTVAHAGTVDDLRASLSKMHADQPIEATLTVRSKATSGDKDKPKTTSTQASFSLHAEGGALQVAYPADLLARVDRESATHAKNPDASEPLQTLLGNMGPLRVRSLVDVAPSLLHRLEGATLESQSDATYGGKPVRLLVFKVPPRVASSDRDDIDHYDGQLKIWMGADGVPVAMSEARNYKGSKFFIHFSFGSSVTMSLHRVGHRLVAETVHLQSSGSGLGNHQHTDTQVELVVKPSDKT